jgi:hypothetical protein
LNKKFEEKTNEKLHSRKDGINIFFNQKLGKKPFETENSSSNFSGFSEYIDTDSSEEPIPPPKGKKLKK